MQSEALRQLDIAGDSVLPEEAPASALAPQWLIDNEEAYDALLSAIADSQESIWISQLAFDADCTAYSVQSGMRGSPGAERNLLDAIISASERNSAGAKILLNSTLLLDTARPLERLLRRRGIDRDRVEVGRMRHFPHLLHAKMVIVDERKAFLIGSPFVNGYWDSTDHEPEDSRRPIREFGGRPLHDISVCFEGPAVRGLVSAFSELWNSAQRRPGSASLRPSTTVSRRRTPSPSIKVVTTAPPRRLEKVDNGSVQIMENLIGGIAGARSLVYIEHQYFSSRRVISELVLALEREPELEIIIVLNQNPDVTAYRGWQNARLTESGLLRHPRVGVFTLWSAAATFAGPLAITQIFVHSKMVIIDDEWALAGSANLDGVSLHSYGADFTGTLARRLFRGVCNFDIGVVMRESRGTHARPGGIARLRTWLWEEHLALSFPQLTLRNRQGPLAMWRGRAAENTASLNARTSGGRGALQGSFILPYSTSARPARQLVDIGVKLDAAELQLLYNPGWLHAHLSANWIRNMFL
jgi:phosphatidylserine/phosphatidylglycerophosphate/cardiolipin synthase-like enzyme